jgi:hypothetical protein
MLFLLLTLCASCEAFLLWFLLALVKEGRKEPREREGGSRVLDK